MAIKFTIPVKLLRRRGYEFHKLYASNHKVYWKKFGKGNDYDLKLWVKGRDVEINDWYSRTDLILNWYRANRHTIAGTGFEIRIHEDKRIEKVDHIEEYRQYEAGTSETYREGWRKIYIAPELLDAVIKEVDFVTSDVF